MKSLIICAAIFFAAATAIAQTQVSTGTNSPNVSNVKGDVNIPAQPNVKTPPVMKTVTPKDTIDLHKYYEDIANMKTINLEWQQQAQQYYAANVQPKLTKLQTEAQDELKKVRDENGWSDTTIYNDVQQTWQEGQPAPPTPTQPEPPKK